MAPRYHRRLVRLADRVEAGSVPEAVALIVAGRVTVNGVMVTNPNALVQTYAAVGYGQLAGWLRQDSRVVNLERTNLAGLGPGLVPDPIAVVCLDLSYLAVSDAVGQLAPLALTEGAQLIGLVKPTFELHASTMIAEPEAVAKAVETAVAAAEKCGWTVQRNTVPVVGAGGAPEVFIYCTRHHQPVTPPTCPENGG